MGRYDEELDPVTGVSVSLPLALRLFDKLIDALLTLRFRWRHRLARKRSKRLPR